MYQETIQPTTLDDLTIRPARPMTNTINVEGKGKLQTLTFSDSVELLKITFTHSPESRLIDECKSTVFAKTTSPFQP